MTRVTTKFNYNADRYRALIKPLLNMFSREQLRILAKDLNIRRGRDKSDTIRMISDSENLDIWLTLTLTSLPSD